MRAWIKSIVLDRPGVPPAAVFDRPLQRLVIHVHDPKAQAVSRCPFKVVHQGPDKVAIHRGAVDDGAMDLCQVVMNSFR